MNKLEEAFELIREIKAPPARLTVGSDELGELLSALKNVTRLAERNICTHEETHRGGAIWEICDSCDAKWADDEGGKPEYEEPPEIVRAHEVMKKYRD